MVPPKIAIQVSGLNSHNSKYIILFLISNSNFIFATDYKKLRGNAEDRELVTDLEGSCSLSAQKTNGTYFNSLKWNPKKAVYHRHLLQLNFTISLRFVMQE